MNNDTTQYYQMKAEIIQAAGHPIRLAIIEFLKDGEKCVFEIAAGIDAQRSNVSRHLSLMQKAGLLRFRKDGLNIYYSLKTPCILKFLGCIDDVLRERLEKQANILKNLKED